MRGARRQPAGLKEALDRLYEDYNRAAAVADPIEIVRRYPDPRDREVVGFCAAALAFGRVASVLQSIERLLAVLGPSPAAFVARFDPSRATRTRSRRSCTAGRAETTSSSSCSPCAG